MFYGWQLMYNYNIKTFKIILMNLDITKKNTFVKEGQKYSFEQTFYEIFFDMEWY